ncbi:MAG: polyhydroxybutyrate depolymerase, partial [Micromonosporaceae bacterium]|nr:polyhydroxybutyrate depolymerase [Micromonosporaceae bacterium]
AYRPAHLPATPVPLVVVLHGALGDGRQAETSYGWDAEADRGGFVVAYPDGYKRTWDASPACCGPAAAQHVDDVAFISALVATISGQLPIDPDRVFATGISNGGLLDYRLACDTRLFAAIGPDSATMINPCPSPAPLSVIHVHGTADLTIPYQGGPGRRDNGGTGRVPIGIDGPPIPTLNATWRATDHCGQPTVSTRGPVTTSVATCPDGRAVELVTIAGAGHQWPGQPGPPRLATRLLQLDPPSMALNATDVIWRFFAAHARRPG